MGQLQTLSGTLSTSEIDRQGQPHFAVLEFRTDTVRHWLRGKQVRAFRPDLQGSGLLFLNDQRVTLQLIVGSVTLTRSFPMDDEHVVTPRHYRFDQVDFAAMVGTVLTPGARLRSLGTDTIDGHHVEVLDVWPSRLPGCARERIGLDPTTHLPITRQSFASQSSAGDGEILHQVVDHSTLNPSLPPDTWRF
jgi:hypothetical protein